MFSKLRGDIACILERDPAARSWWEVLTCYPGLHAIYVHKLAHWFWNHRLRWLGRFTSHFGRWISGIEIHPGAKIGSNAVVVKDVPPGATAIGIPARVVESQPESNGSTGRFAAYAVGRDDNDPLAKVMHELIDHSADTDKRIDEILTELKRLGLQVEAHQAPKIDVNQLNKIVD